MLFLAVVSVVRVLAPPQFPARARGMQGAAFSPGAMAPYLVLPLFGARAWVASFLIVALMPALLRLSLLWRTRVIAAQNPSRQQRQHMAVPQNRCQIKTALVSRLLSRIFFWHHHCSERLAATVLADCDQNSKPENGTLAAGAVLLAGTFTRAGGGDLGGRSNLHTLLTRLVPGISPLHTAMLSCPALCPHRRRACAWPSFAAAPAPRCLF